MEVRSDCIASIREPLYNPTKHVLLAVLTAAINRKCIPLLAPIPKNPKTFS